MVFKHPPSEYIIDVNPYRRLPDERGTILGIPLVFREDWGSSFPSVTEPLEHPVTNVVHTYLSGTEKCCTPDTCKKTIKVIETEHLAHGMTDIAYNFMVGADGRLYEGRGWSVCPQRLKKFPDIAGRFINICFLGSLRHYTPSEYQWKAGFQLLRYAIKQKYLLYDYDVFEIKHKEVIN